MFKIKLSNKRAQHLSFTPTQNRLQAVVHGTNTNKLQSTHSIAQYWRAESVQH
jgi:hypothetical protein